MRNVCRKVNSVYEEQQRTKDGALGNASCDRSRIGHNISNAGGLGSSQKIRLQICAGCAIETDDAQLLKQDIMRDRIERFTKVKEEKKAD